MTQASTPHLDLSTLDALTGGAFTAPTSSERAARIRDWLARDPGQEQLQTVFRELSGRDKGAARPVRERLDELKRARTQEAAAAEWAQKAQALLDAARLNLADALAWQRDAAKAGAPLSREPLATLKTQLAERVRGIEDLQNRVQVQREAAVLLAQRIEVLSTKPWRDAQAAHDALRADIAQWQTQAGEFAADPNWSSLEARFPPLLDASKQQLQVVWDAFDAALAQAAAAASDPAAPLPPVPVWADELRAQRGVATEAAPVKSRPAVPPEQRERANEAVRSALAALEQEIAQGHLKAAAAGAGALRAVLKEHGKLVDDALENQAHVQLAKAGELEGWQRWHADQVREELVRKAESLLEPPPPAGAPAADADTAAADTAEATEPTPAATVDAEASPADAEAVGAAVEEAVPAPPAAQPLPGAAPAAPRKARMGGRKLQETLRSLREQWKQIDQGGPPNHALWRRFDEACNEAHKQVEAWLEKVRTEAAEHRARRLALIEELNTWAADNRSAKDDDWKGFARVLRQFGERWRESGHLNEKAFSELQPQWKAAMQNAQAPLDALQNESVQRRQSMIEEAQALGAQPMLRIDAVKSLQQRWQAEAQRVPIERRHEQKLWDAFRKPIDDAFNRKSAEREQAAAAMGEHDRAVLDASRALEAANASGDAQAIRAAMAALEAALRGQAAGRAAEEATAGGEKNESKTTPSQEQGVDTATQNVANAAESPSDAEAAAQSADAAQPDDSAQPAAAEIAESPAVAPAEPPKPAPKPVIAVRGDDRPGMRKPDSAPLAAGRGGKFGDRRDGRRDERGGGFAGAGRAGGQRDARDGNSRFGERDRAPREEQRGPRLGDLAFRAQREALEHAQAALRKLAAQAHGETVTELLAAWEQRDAGRIPAAQELGSRVAPATRSAWAAALGGGSGSAAKAAEAATALLRLEIAAEAPTPAEHLSERRLLQLQLLTRRSDPGPAQTWGADVATLLATPFDAANARRLQGVLKTLLRR